MSDTSNFDYSESFDFLINKDISNYINGSIIKQKTVLNSDDYNETFKYIENSLNFLYEKTRTLQNIIDYSKAHLYNEINNNIAECKMLLNSIDNDRNIVKNNSYIKYPVPLIANTGTYSDRDTSSLNNAYINNNRITISNTVINKYSPDEVLISYSDKNNALTNTVNTLIEENTYRSLYMLNSPSSSNVKEKITLKFNTAININSIKFDLSNCFISKIELLLDNDNIYTVDTTSQIFKTQSVKEIYIEIYATNYIVSQIDYNKVKTESFWDMVDNINTDENLILDANKYYYYLFGIDNLSVNLVSIDKQSCFISKEIKIDTITEDEYITLEVLDQIQRGDIEYYIIDGTNTTSVLPENKTEVADEKIFYKAPLRFNHDINKPIVVKRNGDIINMSLQDAIGQNDKSSTYTVSYTPVVANISKLNNSSIKIKAVIRNYDSDFESFISNINIKKYGGGKLWIDTL